MPQRHSSRLTKKNASHLTGIANKLKLITGTAQP